MTHLGVSIKANEAAGKLKQLKPELKQQRVPGTQQPQEEAVQPCLTARQISVVGTHRHNTSCSRAWKKRILLRGPLPRLSNTSSEVTELEPTDRTTDRGCPLARHSPAPPQPGFSTANSYTSI